MEKETLGQLEKTEAIRRRSQLRVDVGDLAVWFSYKTPVAFYKLGGERVVRQNDWSTTTGKHLNAIDGGGKDAKKARVTGARFEELFAEAMAGSPIES